MGGGTKLLLLTYTFLQHKCSFLVRIIMTNFEIVLESTIFIFCEKVYVSNSFIYL